MSKTQHLRAFILTGLAVVSTASIVRQTASAQAPASGNQPAAQTEPLRVAEGVWQVKPAKISFAGDNDNRGAAPGGLGGKMLSLGKGIGKRTTAAVGATKDGDAYVRIGDYFFHGLPIGPDGKVSTQDAQGTTLGVLVLKADEHQAVYDGWKSAWGNVRYVAENEIPGQFGAPMTNDLAFATALDVATEINRLKYPYQQPTLANNPTDGNAAMAAIWTTLGATNPPNFKGDNLPGIARDLLHDQNVQVKTYFRNLQKAGMKPEQLLAIYNLAHGITKRPPAPAPAGQAPAPPQQN